MNVFHVKLIAILMFFLGGCSLTQHVESSAELSHFYAYKNIPTGKARNLAGFKTKSGLFEKYYDESPLYIKNKDVYVFVESTSKLIGITTNFDKIYTGKSIEKSILGEGYIKVSRNEIKCKNGTCFYKSIVTGKEIAITQGFSTITNYEFLDYDPVRQKFESCIVKYQFSSLPDVYYDKIAPYIDKDLIIQSLKAAPDRKSLDGLKELVNKMRDSSYDGLYSEKKYEFDFLDDYNRIKGSSVNSKKEFLSKYAGKVPSGTNNYIVVSDSLNIRKSSSSKTAKVGSYRKNEIVRVLDRTEGWLKTEKGWISSKYVRKNGSDKYNKLYSTISNEVDNSDFDIAKNENSMESYHQYISNHPNGINKSKAYSEMLAHFLKDSSNSAIRDELEHHTILDSKDIPLVKSTLIGRLRAERTIEGFSEAYKYSNDVNDLQNVLDRTTSIQDLEVFIARYKEPKIIDNAKKKLAPLYREQDSFSGYLSSYKLFYELIDAKKALSKAKTTEEKSSIEKVVFESMAHKEALIENTISNEGVKYSDYGGGGSFFTRHSFSGQVSPYGKLSVEFKDDAPFRPRTGVYKVDVTVEAVVPIYYQRRSAWLGNVDKNDEFRKECVVSFTFKPPYRRLESNFDIGKTAFVFFERGDAGGYTAKWPRDDMYLSVKNINVSYVGESASTTNSSLYIDFDQLPKLQSMASYEQKPIAGSYSKGSSLISKFDKLDDQKNNRYNSYASSSYSSSSSQSSSSSSGYSSSSSSSSSQNNSGVKEVYDGGNKSSDGYPIYIVKCKQGSKVSAFKKPNGYWFDSSGSNYGDRYRNLSLDDFAAKKCDY